MHKNDKFDIISIAAGDSRPPISIETLLDDRGQTRALRQTLVGIVALALILLAWALVANVDELARARGEVQPDGHIQVLQSQEGGRILELHVREGDAVKEGQVIADFAHTDIEKLRKQTAIKLNAFAIDRERLVSVLNNRSPDFSKFMKDYPLLVEQAKITYREQIASRDAAIAAKRSEGGQQGAMLEGTDRDRTIIERQIKEARERLARLEDGARKGVITQLALSDARQQVSALEERLSDAIARSAATRSTLGGVSSEVSRVRSDFNQQLSQELSKITEQMRELQAEQIALDDRKGRVQIRSPINGIVMNLPQTAEGAVIPAGGTVAEIVPTDGNIVMEVMVQPRDIGFVKEGQRASVKVDSFDAARFGSIEGTVKRVAPTSSKMRENGAPFYKVEIALAKPYVGSVEHRLIPGMTGEADIATGRKSVMQYMLKPIFLASDTAFHER